MSKTKEEKIEILEFYKEYGLKLTISEHKISRATLFRWQRLSRGDAQNLESKSRKPRRTRKTKINVKIKQFIHEIRTKFPRAGRVQIKKWLDRYCLRQGLPKVSDTTVARFLKNLRGI